MTLRIGLGCSIALVAAAAVAAREETVPLERVPARVMDAVKARFAGAGLKGASRETEHGKLVYEITLDDKGRNVDVTLTPGGEMLLIERTVASADLPGPVRQTLERAYPGASYRVLEEIVEVEQGRERLAAFEVLLSTADGHEKEVKVSPEGMTLPGDGGEGAED